MIAGFPDRFIPQDSEGYGPPIQPLKRGEAGTERLSPDLEKLLKEFVQGGALCPNYWPESETDFTNPMPERHAGYSADPMMKFRPANSGSLNYSADRVQNREFVTYKTKCGVGKRQYDSMLGMYNKKKLYGVLKNGKIAVAHDRVVAESVRLNSDISVKTYTLLAKEMCLRMEENVRQGGDRKKWSGLFDQGSNGRADGGDGNADGGGGSVDGAGGSAGGSAGGGGPSGGGRRSREYSHGGNGSKRAKASRTVVDLSGGVFDFTGSDGESG